LITVPREEGGEKKEEPQDQKDKKKKKRGGDCANFLEGELFRILFYFYVVH